MKHQDDQVSERPTKEMVLVFASVQYLDQKCSVQLELAPGHHDDMWDNLSLIHI